jgi:acetyl-CoA acyltransferase
MKTPPCKVIVAGGAIGSFRRCLDLSLSDISAPVVRAALSQTGLEARDIAAGFVGNAFAGNLIGQESILAQVLFAAAGLVGIPARTIKNACSSGSDAVHLAWSAIAFGQYECVLVLGAEKLTNKDPARTFAALASATDHPPVSDSRSIFMDANAARALAYMETYGASAWHFAEVARKNRAHATLNDRAAERAPLTVEQILADRIIVAPLTRSMCGGIVDGAACLILTNETFAARRGLSHTSYLAGSVSTCGVPLGDAAATATRRAAEAAFEQSSISPADVSLAEVHDPTSPQELLDIEDLMLCERGGAIELVEQQATSLGGRLPVNSSGGLTSRGHAVGATGVAQILEIHEQLTGRAGGRQIARPRVGLAQMAGGLLGRDSAVATVHLLSI